MGIATSKGASGMPLARRCPGVDRGEAQTTGG